MDGWMDEWMDVEIDIDINRLKRKYKIKVSTPFVKDLITK
jgi:hypothetical protein